MEKFFNLLGIKTHLSDYEVDESTITKIVLLLKERNWILGENEDIDYKAVEEILHDRI